MTPPGPKISVVTIAFNSERYLADTIASVAAQEYPGIEYIIVDGGSTDGTLEIVNAHRQHIDQLVSGPDDGIADAMNKGLALATGDFVYFLHSDDYLESPTSLAEAALYLDEDHDVFLFNIHLERDGVAALHRPRGFNPWINFKTGVYHQAAICSARLFERIGAFDTDFRITMDYDFFLRAYRYGARARTADVTLATMRLVGLSSQDDWSSLRQRFADERRAHAKNCPSVAMRSVYALYWSAYLPYRRLRHALAG